jgi:death-on-curing family protein
VLGPRAKYKAQGNPLDLSLNSYYFCDNNTRTTCPSIRSARYAPVADILSLAASYGFGLANNHPFIDGNQRVVFMAMYIFLGLNGHQLIATESEVVTHMLDVAVGALDEAGLEAWLRSHAQPI